MVLRRVDFTHFTILTLHRPMCTVKRFRDFHTATRNSATHCYSWPKKTFGWDDVVSGNDVFGLSKLKPCIRWAALFALQ